MLAILRWQRTQALSDVTKTLLQAALIQVAMPLHVLLIVIQTGTSLKISLDVQPVQILTQAVAQTPRIGLLGREAGT